MSDETSTETTPEGDIPDATPDAAEGSDLKSEQDAAEPDENSDQFPRSYVERLRRENATYRERAQVGDTYGQRLHAELVRATGKLADASDLPFNSEHLNDPDALAAAVDELLARKPHLASRRPVGDIGQGPVSGGGSTVDLAAILRQTAQ